MTNQEAYGDRSYEQRAISGYLPGDIVEIGPAYRMGGSYVRDGSEGTYTVIKNLTGSNDYYLARGAWSEIDDSWDLICHAARLTLIHRATSAT